MNDKRIEFRPYYAWTLEWKDKSKDDPHFSSEFIARMLSENLNHVRHIENERLTFHVVYFTVFSAVVVWLFSSDPNNVIQMSLVLKILGLFVVLIMSLFALFLSCRWRIAFERHMDYAKGCYYYLHKSFLRGCGKSGPMDKKEELDPWNYKEFLIVPMDPLDSSKNYIMSYLPFYCFDINRCRNPRKQLVFNRPGTGTVFIFIDVIMVVVTVVSLFKAFFF